MSGGSMDYLTFKVEEVAVELQDKNNTPLQRAFGKHLYKVAKALHDIEWVWSGDYGKGDDEEAIKNVLCDTINNHVIDVLKSDIKESIDELQKYTESKVGVNCATCKHNPHAPYVPEICDKCFITYSKWEKAE